MRIDYVNATRHTLFLPSGTNPLYTKEPEPEKSEVEDIVKMIEQIGMLNYTRDATKETIKGRHIDVLAWLNL